MVAVRLTFSLAAYVRFINLDMAGQKRLHFTLVHLFADFVAHAPSGLVRHAELPLEFLAAHAVARRDEKVDRIKPDLERRPGVLKDRASGRVKMIATGGTGPRAAVAHAMKGAFNTASPADVTLAEAHVEDMHEAGLIVGEALKEVADTKVG